MKAYLGKILVRPIQQTGLLMDSFKYGEIISMGDKKTAPNDPLKVGDVVTIDSKAKGFDISIDETKEPYVLYDRYNIIGVCEGGANSNKLQPYLNFVTVEIEEDDSFTRDTTYLQGKIVALGHIKTSENDPLKIGDTVIFESNTARVLIKGVTLISRFNILAIVE